MKIEEIRHHIDELSQIVASWAADSAPSLIEQDILLSKLRLLYEEVKFLSVGAPVEVAPVVVQEPEPIVIQEPEVLPEIIAEQIDDSIFSIDMDAVSLVEEVVELEPKVAVEVEPELEVIAEEPEPEITAEPEQESEPEVIEESATAGGDNMLFDLDVLPKHNRRRRTVLMSLYDDDSSNSQPQSVADVVAPTEPSEKQEEKPTAIDRTENSARKDSSITPISVGGFSMSHAEKTVADMISADVETVADRLSSIAPRAVISDRLLYRSFDELGINERYLLAQELFGDDPQLCRETLAKISAFDNYDDAMIYIAENFNWNPNLAGTKLLLSVLEQKFNIS
ncbi:MAG: hypothetical protein SNI45_00215 [Rikenellaceae bacterium]